MVSWKVKFKSTSQGVFYLVSIFLEKPSEYIFSMLYQNTYLLTRTHFWNGYQIRSWLCPINMVIFRFYFTPSHFFYFGEEISTHPHNFIPLYNLAQGSICYMHHSDFLFHTILRSGLLIFKCLCFTGMYINLRYTC